MKENGNRKKKQKISEHNQYLILRHFLSLSLSEKHRIEKNRKIWNKTPGQINLTA